MQTQLLTAVVQCGDGVRNGTEECDDGNTESGMHTTNLFGDSFSIEFGYHFIRMA